MSGMPKKVQAKDVPLLPILELLDAVDRGAFVKPGPGLFGESDWRPIWACTWDVMELPEIAPFPEPVVHAKLRALIAKGTIDGCPCGCRGDFTITDKGKARLAVLRGEAEP